MDRLFFEAKMNTGDNGEIAAMAWPFGSADRLGDVIEKGAFAGATTPLPMLYGHDQNATLGSWTEARETDEGLELKGRLLVDEVAQAKEVRALICAGAIRGVSIGFMTRKAKPRKGGGRTITELELVEASLVAVPMHPGARVTSAKSAISALSIAAAINRAAAQLQARSK